MPLKMEFLGPALLGVLIFLAGIGVRQIFFARLGRWAEKSGVRWGDLLVKALRGPSLLWCLMAALYAAMAVSATASHVVGLTGTILGILWVLSLTLVALRLADQVILRYGAAFSAALPLTSLTQNLAKGIILVIGALVILNSLGISITPFLTALGVGGIAVALALQDTLTNLFSGFYIILARQVRVGDYIRLEGGEEGYVVDISWRSTRIRALANNLIVVPNTKLAQTIVTNYDLPTRELAVLVEVGVDYQSDLEKVERLTCEVAQEVMREVSGSVPGFEPFIRFHGFGESGVNFTVILRAHSFEDQYLIKHELLKRLHRRYAQEGIPFPSPTRRVVMESPDAP